jgi:hypothetical protein
VLKYTLILKWDMLLIAFSFLGHTSIKSVFQGEKIMRKVLLPALLGLICSEVGFAQNDKQQSDNKEWMYRTFFNIGTGLGSAIIGTGSGSDEDESEEGLAIKNVGLPVGVSVGIYHRKNLLGVEFSFVKLRMIKISAGGNEIATESESDLMLSGLYHLALNPTLAANIFAGFNLTSIKETNIIPASSETHSGNGIHYGVSAAYTVNPNMGIFAKVFRLDKLTIDHDKFKARDVILLGVQAEF